MSYNKVLISRKLMLLFQSSLGIQLGKRKVDSGGACCSRRNPTKCSISSDVDLSPLPTTQFPTFGSYLKESIVERYNRSVKPVQLVRRPVDQSFAVLLMRSGYNAVDDLDFVAMDEFQAKFFDIRSREWELYLESNNGVRQGIISDAKYFDFISYAQMLTIQYFLRCPQNVFEEKVPVNPDQDGAGFNTVVVRRNVQLYPAPIDILNEWQTIVGNSVYSYMVDKVNRPLPLDEKEKGNVEVIQERIKQIYDYFYVAGYCLAVQWTGEGAKAGKPNGRDGTSLGKVELVAPCTLWGNKSLRRRSGIPQDYDVFCVKAFVAKCGLRAECITEFSENAIFRGWRLL